MSGFLSPSPEVEKGVVYQSVLGFLLVSLLFLPTLILIRMLILAPFTQIEKFSTREIKWAPDGKGMVLFDKEAFCCAFEVVDDVDVGEEEEMY